MRRCQLDDFVARTRDRAIRGVRPDLIGWAAILKSLGLLDVRTGRKWKRQGMPTIMWGSRVSAYADLVRGWAATRSLPKGGEEGRAA